MGIVKIHTENLSPYHIGTKRWDLLRAFERSYLYMYLNVRDAVQNQAENAKTNGGSC